MSLILFSLAILSFLSCGPVTLNLLVEAKHVPQIDLSKYKTFGVTGWNIRVLSSNERQIFSHISESLRAFGLTPLEDKFDLAVDASFQIIPEKVWIPPKKDYELVYVPHPRIKNAGRYEMVQTERGGYWQTIEVSYLKISISETNGAGRTIWDCEAYSKEKPSPTILRIMTKECMAEFPTASGLPRERFISLN